MTETKKTSAQLIRELAELRKCIQAKDLSLNRLAASEARYRNFVENAAEACFEMDLRGHLTFLNKTAGDIFGYSRVNILIHPFGARLLSGIAGIVMILTGGASFQFSAASYFRLHPSTGH